MRSFDTIELGLRSKSRSLSVFGAAHSLEKVTVFGISLDQRTQILSQR